MNRQVKKYEDVGPYPYFGGKSMPPGALPVGEFIEVCWSTECYWP